MTDAQTETETESEDDVFAQVTYVGPSGTGVILPMFDREPIEVGETVTVPLDSVAASLLDQPENWAPANQVARDLLDAIAFITAPGPDVADGCPSCGATGDEPCRTPKGAATKRHSARA